MIRVDTSIAPGVNPGDAYRLVMNGRGRIAAMLRYAAEEASMWDLVRAEAHCCGARRHRLVKRARDTRKRIQRMEIKRMGWDKR